MAPKNSRRRRAGQPINADDLETMQNCIEDGWPLLQIQNTYGYGHATMKKYFPHYKGLPLSEAGALGLAAKSVK